MENQHNDYLGNQNNYFIEGGNGKLVIYEYHDTHFHKGDKPHIHATDLTNTEVADLVVNPDAVLDQAHSQSTHESGQGVTLFTSGILEDIYCMLNVIQKTSRQIDDLIVNIYAVLYGTYTGCDARCRSHLEDVKAGNIQRASEYMQKACIILESL